MSYGFATPEEIAALLAASPPPQVKYNAVRQQQVLAWLAGHNAPNVTAMAGALGVPRPSLSRMLHSLKDKGLVAQDSSRRWSITLAGRNELDRIELEQMRRTHSLIEAIPGHYGPQARYDRFLRFVYDETLAAAQANKPMNSLHEAYAVILEEVDEFWLEVKRKPSQRDRGAMITELVQIAAMCARTAVDLGLLPEEALQIEGSY